MSIHIEGLRRKKYLCGHDQFMVDDVVRGVTHPEQSAGRVQMAGHPSSHIHILPYSLNTQIQSTHWHMCMHVYTHTHTLIQVGPSSILWVVSSGLPFVHRHRHTHTHTLKEK